MYWEKLSRKELSANDPNFGHGENLNSVLGKMIGFMYRYAKFYTKKALEKSPFQTMDEFVFVIAVFQKEGITKMDLIKMNHLEKTTGMEIIKRLIKINMLEQYDHPDDKRSKALKVTETGKLAMFETFPIMQKVSNIIGGDLQEEEKKQLYLLLNKLNDFHLPIFEKEKESSIENIIRNRE
jgi:MarR family transcriptional regulator, lower aerobic nicotinate degradation pathway regulator